MNSNIPADYDKYNSQFGNDKEVIGWSWWDTLTYTTAVTTQLTFFNGVRANLSLSNMELAGQLASPKSFLVRAIRVKPLTPYFVTLDNAAAAIQLGAIDDMNNLINTGTLSFTIGQKNYGQWPLWMLPSGGGAVAINAGAAVANTTQLANNGIQDPRSVYSLTKPILIAPQINFNIVLTWPAAVTLNSGTQNIVVVLDGDLIRPIQ
jgi:hypothetical protein